MENLGAREYLDNFSKVGQLIIPLQEWKEESIDLENWKNVNFYWVDINKIPEIANFLREDGIVMFVPWWENNYFIYKGQKLPKGSNKYGKETETETQFKLPKVDMRQIKWALYYNLHPLNEEANIPNKDVIIVEIGNGGKNFKIYTFQQEVHEQVKKQVEKQVEKTWATVQNIYKSTKIIPKN